MVHFAVKARTFFSLGLSNIGRVALYRFGLKFGVSSVRRLQGKLSTGTFFRKTACSVKIKATTAWQHKALYFGWFPLTCVGRKPDWHINPFNNCRVARSDRPWWSIADFDPKVGDIKTVWEASRFEWVLAMSQRVAIEDERELTRLNAWLTDWCQNNPTYSGPNWKCGQEASIRVVRLAMAAIFLEQIQTPEDALVDLVRAHLVRIHSTMGYAIAQDNNHGTSEAAALFIGGSWLEIVRPDRLSKRCSLLGRKWLENRVSRLIEADGSFSEYSVNYHRVALDTMSIVEIWRQLLSLPMFSESFYERCRCALVWLHTFTQPETGDAPNIGANDGSLLLPLADSDYRDFRPSVQLAAALFLNETAYTNLGPYDQQLKWLKLKKPSTLMSPIVNRLFDKGGYAFLKNGNAKIYLRYPCFQFRPCHADALHLDFWLAGENILRDGGSYSYNTDSKWLNYFQGTASHNTIQFDDRDQMPRIGRFLFGAWLKNQLKSKIRMKDNGIFFEAGYSDNWGASHHREVLLFRSSIKVTDTIGGDFKRAVLRWRLMPGQWAHHETQVTNDTIALKIITDLQPVRMEITEGWESRYYLQKNLLPVVEIEVNRPGKLVTEISWK